MNEKSSGSRSRKQRLTAVGTRCADYVTPLYPQKLALRRPAAAALSVEFARGLRPRSLVLVLVYVYIIQGSPVEIQTPVHY